MADICGSCVRFFKKGIYIPLTGFMTFFMVMITAENVFSLETEIYRVTGGEESNHQKIRILRDPDKRDAEESRREDKQEHQPDSESWYEKAGEVQVDNFSDCTGSVSHSPSNSNSNSPAELNESCSSRFQDAADEITRITEFFENSDMNIRNNGEKEHTGKDNSPPKANTGEVSGGSGQNLMHEIREESYGPGFISSLRNDDFYQDDDTRGIMLFSGERVSLNETVKDSDRMAVTIYVDERLGAENILAICRNLRVENRGTAGTERVTEEGVNGGLLFPLFPSSELTRMLIRLRCPFGINPEAFMVDKVGEVPYVTAGNIQAGSGENFGMSLLRNSNGARIPAVKIPVPGIPALPLNEKSKALFSEKFADARESIIQRIRSNRMPPFNESGIREPENFRQ